MQPATVPAGGQLREFYRDAPLGVRANMIFSADGAAAFGGRAGPLSCPPDQQQLREQRGYADVVLVGAGTVRAERYGPIRLSDEQLAERHAAGRLTLPPLAVVSQTGRLPDSMFTDPNQRPILITSARAAEQHGLTTDSRRSVLVAGEKTVEIATAVDTLRSHGMHRILCEGGPTLLHEIVEADLLTEICITVAPRLAGSQPVGSAPASALAFPVPLTLAHALVHDGYLFSRYVRADLPEATG
jgi:riboflavin biosynthesis pyrimidine reductase